MISKYSHCAQTVHEKERWIRKLPMLVLIYEGIVQKVFEYDYAPASEAGTFKLILYHGHLTPL
jgi:WD repeat-containing protein 35